MVKMKMNFLQIAALYFLVFSLLALSAISAKAETPQYGGVLKIIDKAEGAQPIGVPWLSQGIDTVLQTPVLEPLVREDANGGYRPWLATDWKIDTKNNTITFNLRKGVKFHDGTDFNAEAVAWNLNNSIKAKKFKGFINVDVIDNYTVRVNLEKYQNNHMHNLATSRAKPISPTAYQKMGEEKAKWHPVGTGPFKFVSFKRGDKVVYERWDGYWKEGLPYLDGIEYHFIKDPMTQQAALRTKSDEKVHVLATNSGEQAAMLKAQGLKVVYMPLGPATLEPDSIHDDSPLSNRKVRQAISYAINREAICKARGFGFWGPANQIPSPGNPGYVKDLDFGQYDPGKARKLLKEAGYPKGFKTKISLMPFSIDRDSMVAVQRFLKEVGIAVELDFPDRGGYAALRKDGWHNGFLAQSFRMLGTSNATYDYFFQSTWWPSLKRTPGLIDALNKSLVTEQAEAAKEQAMTRMIADDAMVIPLYCQQEIWVMQNNVMDSGYSEWTVMTNYTPETTWLAK